MSPVPLNLFIKNGEPNGLGRFVGLSIFATITLWFVALLSIPGDHLYAPNRYVMHPITIGGCQYIEVGKPGAREYSLTHRGNCSNPIHVK